MKANNLTERRRSPRIEKEIALKIRADNCDIVTQTKNISSLGAYCTVNRYIPPLTKLAIVLMLPLKEKDNSTQVQCRGVVVRTKNRHPDGFDIAIYFNEINKKNKEKIEKFVKQHSY